MDWVTEAAKEWKNQRIRQETIQRDAAALWNTICNTMEQALKDYEALADRPRHAKVGGRSAHAFHIVVLEGKSPVGMQVARLAIVLDLKQKIVEIRTMGVAARKFPIGLDQGGRACLTQESREFQLEEFTKLALYDLLFPREEGAFLEGED